MSRDTYKDELKNWQDGWSQVFNHLEENKKPLQNKETFFGLTPTTTEDVSEKRKEEVQYWVELYRNFDNKIIVEKTKEQAQKMINAPNPVSYNTVGKDQDVIVTPNFTEGPKLTELNNLKMSLEALERALHSAEVRGEKTEALKSQIETLRNKFDEISNLLNAQPEDVS